MLNIKELIQNHTTIPKSLDTIPEETNPISNDDNRDGMFLSFLENDKFVSNTVLNEEKELTEKQKKELEKKLEKDEKKLKQVQRENERLENKKKREETARLKKEEKEKKKQEDELFSATGSEIYGKDKLQIIAKIEQYKLLFPEIKPLKQLKIKANASIEELYKYLAECEALVECDTLESFLTDSILQTLKMVENVSTRTRYNIKGLSEMLRKNPQFTKLSKQLYLKYKVFSAVPLEFQMLMLVSTSAWICLEKNKSQTIDLNTPIDDNLLEELEFETEI